MPEKSDEKNTMKAGNAGSPEKIPGLKWCCLCDGDRYWHADAGGYFCIDCQPVNLPGRMVLATVPRHEYVVD